MPKLTVMSLNVGRLLQERTRAYLERVSMGTEPIPDVMCIQDVPFRDLGMFEWAPHIAFAPMTNHLINGVRAVVGIAIVSRYFMTDVTYHTTWGDGTLKDLQGINDKNERHLGAESDQLVEATEDRVAICATIVKDNVRYNIATTHGMWVRGGVVNDVQRKCTRELLCVLNVEAWNRKGLVLVGDMNFGRGGEIYQMFINEKFRDCVPLEVDNTLDPDHPAARKGIKVVTDYVMIRPFRDRDVYGISDVRLHPGVSDHCVLSATVSLG